MSPFRIIEAPSTFFPYEVRYYLIHRSGPRAGLRVQWDDREWDRMTYALSPRECGCDKEFVYSHRNDRGKGDCDYSVRFYSREGAEYFLKASREYATKVERLRQRLQEGIPPNLRRHPVGEVPA